ncbi:MAG: HD domain-containing protein [Agathobacter sp.]|nr:HD domain-containing protein [Agathobacter sp.]
MATHTYASIYIGTYDVSLKVFEFSDKRHLREVDRVRCRMELGRGVLMNGRIGYELVELLCGKLAEFKRIAESYRVEQCEAYASDVFRLMTNRLFMLDQILLRTGLAVKILSSTERRFISYEAVAGHEAFESMIKTRAAVVDVGGSSLQITLFREGRLLTTQHIEAGTMKLRTLLGDRGHSLKLYEKQIVEYINKKLEGFRGMYMTDDVDYVILISDYGTELVKRVEKNGANDKLVKSEKFIKFIDKLQKNTLEEITSELNLPNEREPLIVPSIMMFRTLVENIAPKEVWVPGYDIQDGMAYDYAYRNKLLKCAHDFEADVLSAALSMSEHYKSYSPHIDALRSLSTKIYDTLKKVHGLGRRQRLLLEVATILHDCGKFVSMSGSAESAYQIILSSELIGLTHLEREIVALTVLYNTKPLDDYEELSDRLDVESYLTVAKLSAILRVANALDQSHKQKFKNIRIAVKERELVITVEAFEDISLEQALFDAKTRYFENVFSIKPLLKQKKTYSV